MQFKLGWFAHPIFVNGDYPDVMKKLVASKKVSLNATKSRLPEFTTAEKAEINGETLYCARV